MQRSHQKVDWTKGNQKFPREAWHTRAPRCPRARMWNRRKTTNNQRTKVTTSQTRLQNTQAVEKNKTKHTDQAQEAQNRANPSTSQDWRDCEAETSARNELARVITSNLRQWARLSDCKAHQSSLLWKNKNRQSNKQTSDDQADQNPKSQKEPAKRANQASRIEKQLKRQDNTPSVQFIN